ncbi:MAP6 domain-containing protein 1 isoform X2 [Cuculus canorus]|uniref:MAP6 domain-containing protein 1 isoform X2 n=1 Tax=Cuculus canorus TaxID=55661 RepID=UPI0023AAB563|nr:MAP6 domain-containing protein 1 isoform X2 [Cuculus canorus]
MAWPCISRVCCLARFWSQLDKSDLSVPLTIHNYSDIEEPEPGARPSAAEPREPPGARRKGRTAAAAAAAAEPFSAETQYRRDFRAWPLPRRGSCPGRAACALPGAPAPPPLRPRWQQDSGHTTCYRQEYRPWTGAKPSKPIKTKQGFIIPEDHFVQETSYKADFKAPSRILNV